MVPAFPVIQTARPAPPPLYHPVPPVPPLPPSYYPVDVWTTVPNHPISTPCQNHAWRAIGPALPAPDRAEGNALPALTDTSS